jgi:hypothetical protein
MSTHSARGYRTRKKHNIKALVRERLLEQAAAEAVASAREAMLSPAEHGFADVNGLIDQVCVYTCVRVCVLGGFPAYS